MPGFGSLASSPFASAESAAESSLSSAMREMTQDGAGGLGRSDNWGGRRQVRSGEHGSC